MGAELFHGETNIRLSNFCDALEKSVLLIIKRGGFALILSRQHVRIKDCCYLREATFVRQLLHGAENFVGTGVSEPN